MTKDATTLSQWLEKLADFSSTPAALVCALFGIGFWAAAGMMLHFPEGWRLMIDTGANIATLVVVFLVQNMQKRTRRELEAKLDRLIEKAVDRPLTSKDIEKIVNEKVAHVRAEDFRIFKNALGLARFSPAILARFNPARAMHPTLH